MQLEGTATTLDIAGKFLMNTLVLPIILNEIYRRLNYGIAEMICPMVQNVCFFFFKKCYCSSVNVSYI